MTTIPRFKSEDEEAKWWASPKGRDFLKRQSAARASKNRRDRGSWLT
jgi:hypothetical protein